MKKERGKRVQILCVIIESLQGRRMKQKYAVITFRIIERITRRRVWQGAFKDGREAGWSGAGGEGGGREGAGCLSVKLRFPTCDVR
jgi:hypothetical protein